ncbi:MAG: protein archease [Candidatus Atribacteria bacterium]|nr:protein archease [Candidatus Atribacteria bacterium]
MKKFEIIDHTADIGLVAWGRDLPELFSNAAQGMFSIIGEQKEISEETFDTQVELEGSDYEDLLVTWLNELLYIYDTEEVFLHQFEISELGQYYLKAGVKGEPINNQKHQIQRSIKACTYYQVKIEEREPGLFQAQVYFDL